MRSFGHMAYRFLPAMWGACKFFADLPKLLQHCKACRARILKLRCDIKSIDCPLQVELNVFFDAVCERASSTEPS